jgi:hypothetical protein
MHEMPKLNLEKIGHKPHHDAVTMNLPGTNVTRVQVQGMIIILQGLLRVTIIRHGRAHSVVQKPVLKEVA